MGVSVWHVCALVFAIFGWASVLAVAVAVADLAVSAVYYNLCFLAPGNSLGAADCLLLRLMNGCCAAVALTFDRPSIAVGNYVLICHIFSFYVLSTTQRIGEWKTKGLEMSMTGNHDVSNANIVCIIDIVVTL
jgi:hypothetical protein